MTLLKTLADEFSAACNACGACAAMCPALAAAGPDEAPSAIQEQVRKFLKGGSPAATVIDRALLCNECYQCTVDICPTGLNPMRTNLLLRGWLREQDAWTQGEFIPPAATFIACPTNFSLQWTSWTSLRITGHFFPDLPTAAEAIIAL